MVPAIKNGWFNFTKYMIENYFNPNNIDLYDTFTIARKGLHLKNEKPFA